jgi:hypothetical protein
VRLLTELNEMVAGQRPVLAPEQAHATTVVTSPQGGGTVHSGPVKGVQFQ